MDKKIKKVLTKEVKAKIALKAAEKGTRGLLKLDRKQDAKLKKAGVKPE